MPTNKATRIRRPDRFCVIGAKAYNRTWLRSNDLAVEHAQRLMAHQNDASELYVVEIKRVVRRRAAVDVFTVTD